MKKTTIYRKSVSVFNRAPQKFILYSFKIFVFQNMLIMSKKGDYLHYRIKNKNKCYKIVKKKVQKNKFSEEF